MASASSARVYLALLGLILVAVGGVSIVSPPASLTSVAQTVGGVLAVVGVLGLALTATFGSTVTGLTDNQQAALTFVAYIATGLGSVNTAILGFSGSSLWYVSLVVAILGAAGLALKEALGIPVTTAVSKST
jgi:hypothetical protein